ncbi:MAG: c-type cytochrome [Anaerolineales bacterium]|nr:c-type cytochrome [Anaerolineales bacterium]
MGFGDPNRNPRRQRRLEPTVGAPRFASWLLAATAALLITSCGGPSGDPQRGEELYRQQKLGGGAAPGCVSCHSLDPGVVKVGPSHANVGSRAQGVIQEPGYQGEATTAAEYLRESILDPNAHVAEGFDPGVMYQDYAEVLTEQQIEDLVAFLLTQR